MINQEGRRSHATVPFRNQRIMNMIVFLTELMHFYTEYPWRVCCTQYMDAFTYLSEEILSLCAIYCLLNIRIYLGNIFPRIFLQPAKEY